MITGPAMGVIKLDLSEIRVDGMDVEEAKQGDHFSIKVNEIIRTSTKLYKIVNA